MGKMIFAVVLGLFAGAVSGQEAAGEKELISNGNFAEVAKARTDEGETITFPKGWLVAGRSVGMHKVEKTEKGNTVWISGLMYGGFKAPEGQPPGNYVVTIRAKGGEDISCSIWAWKGELRENQRKEESEKQTLSADFKDYTFKFKYIPEETYVGLYISGMNLTMENVSVTLKK